MLEWTKLTPAAGNTYKREITDLQSGNRGNDFQIMSGLHDNSKSILRDAMDEVEHSH